MRSLVIAATLVAVGALVATDAVVAGAASAGEAPTASVTAPVTATGTDAIAAEGTAADAVAVLKRSAPDRALRGLSVAGAEFTSIGTPAFDRPATFGYLAARGYTLVRIPFRWEAMQRELSGPLDPAAVSALHAAVDAAGAAGLAVVLDVHNYARYDGIAYGAPGSFTSGDLADLWRRLALEFAGDGAVAGYGLMNEPRALPTVDGVSGNIRWQRAQQAALDAIRATGDDTCVIVSRYSAGAMGAWLNASTGQPAPYIVDPLDNIRWEAHHYWDAGNTGAYTGTYADAVATGFGSSQGDALRTRTWFELDQWLSWLKRYGQRGFIGEFGWPSAQTGLSADEAAEWQSLAAMYLGRIDQEDPSLVWTAAWATGSRWSAGYALQFYGSTDGVLSTPLSNASVLEAFAREVTPSPVEPGGGAGVAGDGSADGLAGGSGSDGDHASSNGSAGVTGASGAAGGAGGAGSGGAGPGAADSAGSTGTGGDTGGVAWGASAKPETRARLSTSSGPSGDSAAGGIPAAGGRSAGAAPTRTTGGGPTGAKAASRTTSAPVATRVKRSERARIRVTVSPAPKPGSTSRSTRRGTPSGLPNGATSAGPASGVTGRATGSVTVRWRGHVVGRATVRGTRVVIRLARALPLGTQNLVVSYAGSARFAASADRVNRIRVVR
ncbi:cellulase family glycosylhydrolase [Galbitalea sp. SE-J8]|uniref:glycoside hydrolase family 5 protein n=1 Tax=Galbitalea sp. SE-J8 TaxID=3054952 RepID=UPI00259CCD50|nr:cellulase family glycosylhydrolase [Galbitalea sp. SE-J8]MDM4763955.1 cellulase family glycosylhydrolase [Galbitalea sp. SE-J8]